MGELFTAGSVFPWEAAEAVKPEDIALEPLSSTQWRVCNRAAPASDSAHLLGFIEQTEGRFEAMELGRGHNFAWHDFDTLAEASEHFRTVIPTGAPSRAAGSAWTGR